MMSWKVRLAGLWGFTCFVLVACAGDSASRDGRDLLQDDVVGLTPAAGMSDVAILGPMAGAQEDTPVPVATAGAATAAGTGGMSTNPNDGMPTNPDAGMTMNPDAGMATGVPGGGSADLSSCAPPPDGASATAVQAWTMVNEVRLAAGAGCIDMVPELNTSAQSHCEYRAANSSDPACRGDAHTQVTGCPGFTGTNVQAREVAAGYPRQLAYTEVAFTYGDNPTQAIPGWLATVYHRIPLLDPWTTDMGWGGAAGCDVIDLGRGMPTVSDDTIVVYPYDGQVDVPPTFNGIEGPAPPEPSGGWPSSYPINIYAQDISVTEHVLTKDGDATPLDHLWLDSGSPEIGSLRVYFGNTAFLYGAPFEPNTAYRVKLVGTHAGGAFNVEWTFTTGEMRRFGF